MTGLREIWRRRKGSFGSVREVFRGRGASVEERGVSWGAGGGRREESLIGRSTSSVDEEERWVFRFGDVGVGVVVPEDVRWRWVRSVEAKLRAEGLSGGVVSPGAEGSMMVFLHFSQIPSVDVMGRLQDLHIATVVEVYFRWRGEKPKSNFVLAAMVGTLGDGLGS